MSLLIHLAKKKPCGEPAEEQVNCFERESEVSMLPDRADPVTAALTQHFEYNM